MTNDRKHDPISLPAGSFDLESLEKVSAAAVKAHDADRDRTVGELLEKSANRVEGSGDRAPGLLPGHRLETVEILRSEGTKVPTGHGKQTETVGRVVETRTIQVFDAAQAVEEAEATAEATAGPASTGTEARS